jgi:signal transduction histidine kinase
MTDPSKQNVPTQGDGSHSHNSVANGNSDSEDEKQKLRQLVLAYEARIDEVAEVIKRVRHEINNPLTGVLGQAQLLLREDLNEKTRKRVQTIEELAIRLRDIVGQLRQVQKVSKS